MGMSTFCSDNLIDFVFRNQENLGNYDTIRILLKKTDGTYYDNGTAATDYLAVNRDSSAWGVYSSSGFAYNEQELDFPPNQTGGTVAINGFVLQIAGIGQPVYNILNGNIVNSSGSPTTLNIPKGETPRMNVGAIVVNVDNSQYFTLEFRAIISKYLFRNDKTNFGNDFMFALYNGGTPLLNQEQGVTRDASNFSVVNNSTYMSVTNSNDIIYPLYSGGNTTVNRIRFFYGTFPNPFSSYTYAGIMDLDIALTLNTFKTVKIPADTLDGMFK